MLKTGSSLLNFFAIVLFAVVANAANSGNENPYHLPGFEVSQERFFNFLRKEAPADFCAADSYFVKCFSVLESSCAKEVQQQIDQCHKSLRLPANFDVLEIEAQAERIGSCVGIGLEKKWHAQKSGEKECRQRF